MTSEARQGALSTARRPFWKGHGLWRFPNFFRSLYLDTPAWGLATASQLHFRRLTLESAARKLPEINLRRIGEPLSVYFMSGREHWAMTAFCAFSLMNSTRANLVAIIIDDGTLRDPERGELRRILPGLRFLDNAEIEARVLSALPPSRYPFLYTMRERLPLMRKLIDLHAGERGWRLFLDSDMLFFREPQWMLDFLRNPHHPVYMWDYQDSYGYSSALMESVLGRSMPEKVNTGFCALRSDAIGWDQLEHWAKQLHSAEGTNHFSEQCLTAMMMTRNGGQAAPTEYMIWPSKEESRRPSAVMHHYVAESRTWYHIYGWPGMLRRARQ